MSKRIKRRWNYSGVARFSGVVVFCFVAVLLVGCPAEGPPGPTGPQGPTGPTGPPGPAAPNPAVAAGINITIDEVIIPADRRPEITFTAKDDLGNTIPLNEFTDVRFTLAHLEQPAGAKTALSPRYISYSTNSSGQSTYDPGRYRSTSSPGGATQNTDGTIGYKFATVLPVSYDVTATHQLGGQFRRTWVVDGQTYPANSITTFRPDGGVVSQTREIVATETCNECHTRLSFHGNIRREVQYCILCHNDQTIDPDTGNSVDFPVLIHKIHMGENLPSVEGGTPYQIIGHGGPSNPNDFSDVVFPQDIRNCTRCHDSSAKAADADIYRNGPSLAGCASCHDRTWFGDPDLTPAGYEDHEGGQNTDDSLCALCHPAQAPGVAPILDAHEIPEFSDEAPGLFLDITDVRTSLTKEEDTALEITFTAEDGDGAPYTDLSAFTRLRVLVAYPTTDYEWYERETIAHSSNPTDGILVNNGDGSYDYTFAMLLDSSLEGTFAVGLEGRIEFDFHGETERQGTLSNGLTFFTLPAAKAVPEPRRVVVLDENCSECHREIRMHGDSRFGTQYCVMCHNPNNADLEEEPPVSVNFKDLIHRLHTGHDLENRFVIGSHVYNDGEGEGLHFPGRREVCEICHDEDTYLLPLPEGVLSTVVATEDTKAIISEELPIRAACTSCHDSLETGIHALLQTDTELRVETCIVCHGEDAAFDIEVVHDIGP